MPGLLLGFVGRAISTGLKVGKFGSLIGAAKPVGGLVRAVSQSGMAGRMATMQSMGGFGLSFGGSSQTRSMLTNMVNYESTTFFSSAKMTIAELSWYLPKANLSAEFRHAIEQLPCCEMTPMREQYIYDLILSTFGTTFLPTIVLGEYLTTGTEMYIVLLRFIAEFLRVDSNFCVSLGGMAQNTIIIKNTRLRNVTERGYDASQFSNMAFGNLFNFGSQSESAADREALANFQHTITSSRSTTQGNL